MCLDFLAATALDEIITLEDGKYRPKLPPLDQHSNHLYYVIDLMLNNCYYEDGFLYSSYIQKYLHLLQDQGNFVDSKLLKGLSNLMIRISYKLWNGAMKFEHSNASINNTETFKTTLKYRMLSVLCLAEANCSFEEVVDRTVKSSMKFQKDCGVNIDYNVLINHFEFVSEVFVKKAKAMADSHCSVTEKCVMSILDFGQHLGTVYRKAGKLKKASPVLEQLQKHVNNLNIEGRNSSKSLQRVLFCVPSIWKIMLEFSLLSVQIETKKSSKAKSDYETLEELLDDTSNSISECLTDKDLSYLCVSTLLDSLETLKSFLHSTYSVCTKGQNNVLPYRVFVKIVSLFLNCVGLLKLHCQLTEAKVSRERNKEQRKLLCQKHQKLHDCQLAVFTFLALQYQAQFQAITQTNCKVTDVKKR